MDNKEVALEILMKTFNFTPVVRKEIQSELIKHYKEILKELED